MAAGVLGTRAQTSSSAGNPDRPGPHFPTVDRATYLTAVSFPFKMILIPKGSLRTK